MRHFDDGRAPVDSWAGLAGVHYLIMSTVWGKLSNSCEGQSSNSPCTKYRIFAQYRMV
jgi:hypothetical protein